MTIQNGRVGFELTMALEGLQVTHLLIPKRIYFRVVWVNFREWKFVAEKYTNRRLLLKAYFLVAI
jgi:hypothetical protein